MPDKIQLKGGHFTSDPRLDRIPEFDEQSRKFNVADRLGTVVALKGKTWSINVWLDQGQDGACVGFSRSYDLNAYPRRETADGGIPVNNESAFAVYKQAQKLDEWPGEDYEGTSVLAGCKAAQKLGYVGSYHWAFNIDDMCRAISAIGPVVVGTNWFNSMFDPEPGTNLLNIDPSSGVAGGHAWCIHRISVTKDGQRGWLGKGAKLHDGVPLLGMRQSWGRSWGKDGSAFLWADDFERGLMKGSDMSIVTEAFHRNIAR